MSNIPGVHLWIRSHSGDLFHQHTHAMGALIVAVARVEFLPVRLRHLPT